MDIFGLPVSGMVPTLFLQFSCLPLFIPVESKHKAAFASFCQMLPLLF